MSASASAKASASYSKDTQAGTFGMQQGKPKYSMSTGSATVEADLEKGVSWSWGKKKTDDKDKKEQKSGD